MSRPGNQGCNIVVGGSCPGGRIAAGHVAGGALTAWVVALARAGRPPRGALLSGPVRVSALAGRPAGVDAYRDPAVWVGVSDYAPAYQNPGRRSAVMPEQVRAVAEAGFRTVFVQTAGTDRRSAAGTADAALIGRFLSAAHRHSLRVVGWYRPTLVDVDEDLHRLRAAATFAAGEHRFDGLAVDIEANPAVGDPQVRSARLLDLSRRLRQATVGVGLATAAIVPPPVLLDDISPEMWPRFPSRNCVPCTKCGSPWRTAAAEQRTAIATAIRRAGGDHLAVRTDRDCLSDVARFFRLRRERFRGTHRPAPGVRR